MEPLRFYDHDRQSYGHLPIDNAAEFMVGDYGRKLDDGVAEGGQFKIALIRLSKSGPFGDNGYELLPQLQVFGDAGGSLRRAIDAGLLDALERVDTSDEFAARLVALGMVDVSDFPVGSPPAKCSCCGEPNRRRAKLELGGGRDA